MPEAFLRESITLSPSIVDLGDFPESKKCFLRAGRGEGAWLVMHVE